MTNPFLQLGVIGDPVAHSDSPEMFNPALQALRINGHYDRYHVTARDLPAFFARLRNQDIHGVNVTLPHKQAVIPLLDDLTGTATNIGAVNTIYRHNDKLIGDNTDGEGFWRGLAGLQPTAHDAIILIGVGGAARAIGYTLLQKGATRLTLVNRDAAKAQSLREDWQRQFPNARLNVLPWDVFLQNGTDGALLVNATALGLNNQNPWPDLAFLKTLPRTALVTDIVAKPVSTQLLIAASALNLKTCPGWPMLLHQAELAFARFTGQPAPLDVMKDALLRQLGGVTA